MGSYTFSGEMLEDFSRIFLVPTLIYMNLPSTKQNVCIVSYVLGINTCTYRNDRQREWECKRDIHCALVAQWTCAKVTREQWEQKNKCFHTFGKHFENFIPCVIEHLFSFTLKLISVDIFPFCSVKKSKDIQKPKPISSNFKAFKSDSRNSRVLKTHIYHEVKILE